MAKEMDVKDKRVLVVGLGKSGVAAALFLQSRGARVTVSDSKPETQLSLEIPALLEMGVAVETGAHGDRTFRDQDLIVLSPGVPADVAALQTARALGIPVIGEIELAWRFFSGPVAAITGSNGKTTTTALLGAVIAKSGGPVLIGGNIGRPATDLAPESKAGTWHVLEVSSFQLETISEFHPRIAVLLNLTPDHLDRHGSFELYQAAKARVFENQQAADFAVLNADDASCLAMAARVRSRIYWFSILRAVENGAYIKEGNVVLRVAAAAADFGPPFDGREHFIMPVSEVPLKGGHNLENVLAAACAGFLAGCSPEVIRAAVREFMAVDHRLQWIATIHGVEYFNDSKATNTDATAKALDSFAGNIHLILGGKDKDSDYSVLQPFIRQKVKRVYTIGAAAEKIVSQIAGAAEIVRSGTLASAVRSAAAAAQAGDIVLLSPACASFDQFASYEHRGRAFAELVAALSAKPAQSAGHPPASRRVNG